MTTYTVLRPDGYSGPPYGSFTKPLIVNTLNLTDTIDNLNMPINCVIAGQQKEPVKKAMGLTGAMSGPLRGIFNE